MGVNYNPKIVNNGLILHVDAANSKSYDGSSTMYNLADLNSNGTISSGITYSSDNQGSLVFDGSAYLVSFLNTQLISNDFTHVAWAKRDGDSTSGIGGIFGNHYHTQLAGAGLFFRNASTYVDMSAGNGSSRPSHRVNLPRLNTLWNQYVIRYSGTTYDFFFNGELLDSRTAVVVQSSLTIRFAIGRWAPSYGSYYLNGKVSSCSSYNVALSNEDIHNNFNALRGRYGI